MHIVIIRRYVTDIMTLLVSLHLPLPNINQRTAVLSNTTIPNGTTQCYSDCQSLASSSLQVSRAFYNYFVGPSLAPRRDNG